jgi:hypothetical protein
MKHHIHKSSQSLPMSVKIIFAAVIASNILAAIFILKISSY